MLLPCYGKSSYLYIKYVRLGLVWFYVISTIVGQFNAKSFLCMYIKYMIYKNIFYITFLNDPVLIFSLLNVFTYFHQIRIIQFIINHLFAHSLMFSSVDMYH